MVLSHPRNHAQQVRASKPKRVAPRSTRRVCCGVCVMLERFYMTLKRTHGISLGTQRFALPAGGWEEIARESRKKLKARKMLENAARTRQSGARCVRHDLEKDAFQLRQ